MTTLTWDNVGARTFESGVDRAVLYFPDGRVIPWSGLTNVQKKFGQSSDPIYFDGSKVGDIVASGGFSASVTAITYPDELEEFYGNAELRSGVYLGEQPSKTFGLSFRTRVGNDVDGDEAGYKIHVIYNASAVPSDHNYTTVSDSPELTEFAWDLTAIASPIPGYKPSAHLTFDTTKIPTSLTTQLEAFLYGTSSSDPVLPSIASLVELINEWYVILIIDEKDGTWSAVSDLPGYIVQVDSTTYDIHNAEITWIDEDTYEITGTEDIPGS